MSKTNRDQSILNWLESEKLKDSKDIENTKRKYIEEIQNIKKEELFIIPKKLTLWQKIKILISRNYIKPIWIFTSFIKENFDINLLMFNSLFASPNSKVVELVSV